METSNKQTEQYHLQYNPATDFFILVIVKTGIQTAILCDEDILGGVRNLQWYPVSELYEYEGCSYSHLKEIEFSQYDLAELAEYAKKVDALCI